jgi:hypothetical protein
MTHVEEATVHEVPEGRLRQWILNHDDSWWFIVPYIGLAVILSIVLSLFWLVMVVMVHIVLETLRQWYIKPEFWGVISRVLWEVKLDIILVLFALVLSLYMELTLGILGIGNVARAGALAGSRALVLQRVLRAILLSLDDMAQVLRVLLRRKGGKDDDTEADAEPTLPSSWTGNWSRGDVFTIGFGVVCILLIVAAPIITHHTPSSTLETLIGELHPFPADEDSMMDEIELD